MASSIRNIFRKRKLKELSKILRDSLVELDPEIVEGFIKLLLKVMSLVLWVDKNYHRNIRDFKGKYLFESKDGELRVGATFKRSLIFRHDYLKVSDGKLAGADITVTFKDTKALMRLLLNPKPDILGAVLASEVAVTGNVNYILKFGFMATQLQQMLLSAVQ